MSFAVTTPAFMGPLDLLLQLITAHRLEITEVSLTNLVGEYVSYLEVMRDLDLDITSEFLVIAATLIQLKARHLLPDDAAVDMDEDLALAEERDRLLARLLACLTFKDVAALIGHRLETSAQLVGRAVGVDPGLDFAPPVVRTDIDAAILAGTAAHLFERWTAQPDLDHLDLDLPSVEEAIGELQRRIANEMETDFDRVTAHCTRPLEMVAYFLAVLELARWGLVEASQDGLGAPILLRHREGAVTGVSEWAP